MSALRSGIEELAGEDLTTRSYDDLTHDVAEISGVIDRLTCQLAHRVREMDTRGEHVSAGFANTTQWLAHTADLDSATARSLLSTGRFLSEHQETDNHFESGEMSRSRIRVLSRAGQKHPAAYGEDEEMLLGFAREMTMWEMTYAVRYWCKVVDDKEDRDESTQRDRSYFHASRMLSGMVRFDGQIDGERGEAILAALQAATAPRTADDTRPAANRRAEALHEICYQWLGRAEAPMSGGVRPHVSLIVDLETLMGRMGTDCRLGRCTISPEAARRILCDASVSRIITGPDSMPLDVGRASRTATPAQRRALAIRDGGCRAPGCDRPPEWCDVHHRIPWILGGRTDLEDLVLLCRRHHTMVHDGVLILE